MIFTDAKRLSSSDLPATRTISFYELNLEFLELF